MKGITMRLVIFVFALVFFGSCDDPAPTPRPRGFPRVIYPEKQYVDFDKDYCNFTFRMPAYAAIEKDTLFFDEKPMDECWFNIHFPDFDSDIHFSYFPVGGANSLEKLRGDAFELAAKHNVKANYIDELPISRPDGTIGMVFDIEGAVASPFQFYLTDGSKHYLRGALYFNTQAKPDSLAPVLNFLKTDILEMINTLEWNN